MASTVNVECLSVLGQRLSDNLKSVFPHVERCNDLEIGHDRLDTANEGLLVTLNFSLETGKARLKQEIAQMTDGLLVEQKEASLDAIDYSLKHVRTRLWKEIESYLSESSFQNGQYSNCGRKIFSNGKIQLHLSLLVDEVAEQVRIEIQVF